MRMLLGKSMLKPDARSGENFRVGQVFAAYMPILDFNVAVRL